MDKGTGSTWGDVGELLDNTTYFYQIRSINIVDVKSVESATVSATTKPMLDKITGLSAVKNQVKQVALSWNPSDGKEFQIFRGETPASVKKEIATVGSNTLKYIDKNLEDGKQYFYKVRAVDSFDLPGVFSDFVDARTKPLPGKPTNLTHSINGTQLTLSWSASPETDISVYKILEEGFFSWETIGDTAETSFSPVKQLEKGDKNIYQVIAVDSDGLESLPSNKIKVVVPK
jgi:fibronectin type 3 domain-containing protein